jgi:hypothetical protein
MKNILTFCLLIILSTSNLSAANFSNFVEEHTRLQKKLAKIESRITINSNLLSSANPQLRLLKKDLKKINKRHKKIYKSLVKQLKISKNNLELVKTRQQSMKFNKNDNELQDNLVNSYNLAAENNKHLEAIIEDSKAEAYTDSTSSGLYGRISMITGNCMPTIGAKELNDCKESSFPTIVVIRELTTVKDLDKYTYYSGSKEPLFNITTDDTGLYKLDLAPGEYSVFILDDSDKEYCDSYDGAGNACKVTITKDMYSEFNTSLDRASY